jgi:hypothetical protein
MKFDLFQYMFALGTFYIYGRILLHYGLNGINYMLNQKFTFKAKLEKPRILFLLVGLVFMHLMIHANQTVVNKSDFFLSITTIVFSLAFFISHLPWTRRFEFFFTKESYSRTHKASKNFELKISELQTKQLYNELVRYDLVQQDRTSFLDFKNVFTQDWDSHSSKIYFKMDGPSCREFFYHLVQTFPNNSLTLINFFDRSKLIVRPDGTRYKYNTIKNAPTRSSQSKKHFELKQIFNKIN